MWNGGVLPQAYHRYPDRSICAFMPGEWAIGDEPLSTYLDWCVYWLGRALHLEFFDHWPGRQHCLSVVRVERDRPDDYCGCGSDKRWRECCMTEDLSRSRYDLVMGQWRANARYLFEVRRRGLPVEPPWERCRPKLLDVAGGLE